MWTKNIIMSKKEKLQIGNYLISREGNEIERIKIESVSGNWSMKVPSFNGQFKLFEYLSNNEAYHKTFETYITIMYLTCNLVPDIQFMNDFGNIYESLSKRASSEKKEVTEEEDKADIDAAKEMYNIQKEAESNNLNTENGENI